MSASWAVRKTASAASEGRPPRLAADLQRALDPVGAHVLDQVLEPVRSGDRVAAQRFDRRPRLVESRGGVAVGAADRGDHLGVDVAVERQQAGALELHRERRERVGEDVVELARDPAALVERRRLVARQPRPLLLVEQFLRLDLVVLAEPQQVADDEHEDVGDVGPGEDQEAFARGREDADVDDRDDRDDRRERQPFRQPDHRRGDRRVGAEHRGAGRLHRHQRDRGVAEQADEDELGAVVLGVEEELDRDQDRDRAAAEEGDQAFAAERRGRGADQARDQDQDHRDDRPDPHPLRRLAVRREPVAQEHDPLRAVRLVVGAEDLHAHRL